MTAPLPREVNQLAKRLLQLEMTPTKETMNTRIRMRIAPPPTPVFVEKKDVGTIERGREGIKDITQPVLVVRGRKKPPQIIGPPHPDVEDLLEHLHRLEDVSGANYHKALALLLRMHAQKASEIQVMRIKSMVVEKIKEDAGVDRVQNKKIKIERVLQLEARRISLLKVVRMMALRRRMDLPVPEFIN